MVSDLLLMCERNIGESSYLPDSLVIERCRPVVEQLLQEKEQWLNCEYDGYIEMYAGLLSCYYCITNQLDACLDIRKEAYEILSQHNYERAYMLMPDDYSIPFDSNGFIAQYYDKYGRVIGSDRVDNEHWDQFYGESGKMTGSTMYRGLQDGTTSTNETTYEYDSEGRIAEIVEIRSSEYYLEKSVQTFAYTNDGFTRHQELYHDDVLTYSDDIDASLDKNGRENYGNPYNVVEND